MTGGTNLGPVDVALALEAAALTKTATFHGTGLDLGNGYAPGGAGQPAVATIPVSAADFTSGDETYSIVMEHSDDNATFTACGVAQSVLVGDVGEGVMISGFIRKRYVRYTLTIGGTTPTITYGGIFLRPLDIT